MPRKVRTRFCSSSVQTWKAPLVMSFCPTRSPARSACRTAACRLDRNWGAGQGGAIQAVRGQLGCWCGRRWAAGIALVILPCKRAAKMHHKGGAPRLSAARHLRRRAQQQQGAAGHQ